MTYLTTKGWIYHSAEYDDDDDGDNQNTASK